MSQLVSWVTKYKKIEFITIKSFLKKRVRLVLFIILIILVTSAFLWANYFAGFGVGKSATPTVKAEVADPKKIMDINQEFTFPVKDDKERDVGKIKYTVESVRLQDEIILQGQKANAIKGRTFLVVNLKVTSDLKQALRINTRDYIRLSINGNDKDLLAPDIHNDPVEIQAISTKLTRVGFPIEENFQSLKLSIGEINGPKQAVNITF